MSEAWPHDNSEKHAEAARKGWRGRMTVQRSIIRTVNRKARQQKTVKAPIYIVDRSYASLDNALAHGDYDASQAIRKFRGKATIRRQWLTSQQLKHKEESKTQDELSKGYHYNIGAARRYQTELDEMGDQP